MGCSKVLHRLFLAAVLAVTAAGLSAATQEPAPATFKSSLDLVSVAVVVRDGGGRLMTGSARRGLRDRRRRRQSDRSSHFQAGRDADARLALLVDSSGSMVVGAKPERTRLAADFLITGLRPADVATVFSFDSEIRRLTPFTSDPNAAPAAVSRVVPYGTTCLFDAIVATARTVQDDAPRARAVVLLTDGIDTASLHSADDAATAAARLDLPVYVIGVGSLAGQAGLSARDESAGAVQLVELARRTGGLAGRGATPAQLSVADPEHPRRIAPSVRDGVRRRRPAGVASVAGQGPARTRQRPLARRLLRALTHSEPPEPMNLMNP